MRTIRPRMLSTLAPARGFLEVRVPPSTHRPTLQTDFRGRRSSSEVRRRLVHPPPPAGQTRLAVHRRRSMELRPRWDSGTSPCRWRSRGFAITRRRRCSARLRSACSSARFPGTKPPFGFWWISCGQCPVLRAVDLFPCHRPQAPRYCSSWHKRRHASSQSDSRSYDCCFRIVVGRS